MTASSVIVVASIAEVISGLRGVLERLAVARAHLFTAHSVQQTARIGYATATTGAQHREAHDLARFSALAEQQIRDLTELVAQGENAIGAMVANLAGVQFSSTEWLTEVGQTIHPETTKVTTAIAFDTHGASIGTKISAVDQEAAEVQEFLEQSHQFPKPIGWRAGAKLAVSSHVETKYALWMRKTGVRQLTVVINNDRVCPGAFGCAPAVRCILPRGSVMTVLSTTSGLRWELKGVAESCS
jgi:hypothetical protein